MSIFGEIQTGELYDIQQEDYQREVQHDDVVWRYNHRRWCYDRSWH